MLRGEQVILGPFDQSHGGRTRQWANDPELARLLGRSRPVSDREHEQWLETLATRDDRVFFAVHARDGEAHIGNVWLWDVDARHRKAELRIVIGERGHTGKGHGTEAIRLASDYGFEWLNLHKIYAYVLDLNPRAARSFEKAGFTREGILRQDRWVGERYADVFLLARIQGTVA